MVEKTLVKAEEVPLTEQASSEGGQKVDKPLNKEMAEMNGVVIEENAKKQEIKKGEKVETEVEPEPEQVVTVVGTWQQAWLKLGVVALGILVVVLSVVLVGFNALDSINTASKKNPAVARSPGTIPLPGETPHDDKATMALTTQKGDLRKLNEQSLASQPKVVETAQPQVTLAPVPTSRPRPQITVTPKPPVTKSQPIATIPINREYGNDHKEGEYQKQTYVVPKVAPQLVQSVRPQSQIDPMQQWALASTVGNYVGSSVSSVKEVSFVNLSKSKDSQKIAQNTNQNTDIKHVLIGSSAFGRIQNPVAWGRGLNQNQNVLIKTSTPMKAVDDSIAIPADTLITAKLISSSDSNVLQISVNSIKINGIERTVPENSILVFSKKGEPLRAKSQTRGGGLGGTILSSVLSGVSKAAEVENQATSQISVASSGYSSFSSNSQRNVGAGFLQGTAQNLGQQIQNQSQRSSQSVQSESKVFSVKEGTEIKLIANQNFDL